jgi:hypothetical protein
VINSPDVEIWRLCPIFQIGPRKSDESSNAIIFPSFDMMMEEGSER